MLTVKNKFNIRKDRLKSRIHRLLNTTVFKNTETEHQSRLRFYSSFLKPGYLCYDVGANLGNRTRVFLELQTKVLAVEPQDSCYYHLQLEFGNRITLVKKGLSNKIGSTILHVAESSTISSISEEWISSVGKRRFKSSNWDQKEEIELSTLDELIRLYGIPDFIKIDVEGHEPEVLEGLSQAVNCISIEYTTPEQTDKLFNCLNRLNSLSPNYLYNFSMGETNSFALNTWLPASEFLSLLKQDIEVLKGFGDVYAKLASV